MSKLTPAWERNSWTGYTDREGLCHSELERDVNEGMLTESATTSSIPSQTPSHGRTHHIEHAKPPILHSRVVERIAMTFWTRKLRLKPKNSTANNSAANDSAGGTNASTTTPTPQKPPPKIHMPAFKESGRRGQMIHVPNKNAFSWNTRKPLETPAWMWRRIRRSCGLENWSVEEIIQGRDLEYEGRW